MLSDFKGLSTKEAKELQKKYGLNEIIKSKKNNAVLKFICVFKEPMFLLLVGAALLYFILGEPKEAFVMLIFVLFVATITFVQEWKTEKTMNALKSLTSPEVYALRDGEKKYIKAMELVPGDIVFISEGNRIPADCEVLEVSNFSVDESNLTGESEPVYKCPSNNLEDSEDHWKRNMLYAGTLCIFGKCTAKVKLTGLSTEYGKIGKIICETKENETPLQKKVNQLVKSLAIAGFILCLLVIISSYAYNKDLLKSILAGITLAMAIIPEEFPVVLTVFLSLGAFRLAKKNTLIRKISAVETLGSATVLCVDKTGTITKNQMEVKKIYTNNEFINKKDFCSEILSELMIKCCEKDPYDPMEKAIVLCGSKNYDIKNLNSCQVVKKFAFDAKTKRMCNIFKDDLGYYLAAKGSPETILPLCKIQEEDKQVICNAIDKMASKGLRVLAFADCITHKLKEKMEDYEFQFKMLVGLQDPPKDNVKEAILTCVEAGIRVVMITGDYNKTAVAIGEEIGLKFADKSISGEEIDRMNEDELCEAVKTCDVFSRVIPEHKMKIIKALRRNGDIVAMTGDGVNDAPALKNADIGIAMGKRGTEVAKEAAHMILMDDNFTTIVNSVEDGRRVFDNIRKSMVYIMIIHIPIALLALCAPLFNLPQLLLPMHIMLMELIIDPTCSIVFEGEKAEPYIMKQPPRAPNEPLLTKALLIKVLLQGISIFLAAFLPFHYIVDSNTSELFARSFSLITLVVANVVLVLVNRSNTEYLFDIVKEKGNKTRLIINGLAFIIMFSVVYIPQLQPFFKTKALDFKSFTLAVILGFVASGWWEIVKVFKSKKQNCEHCKDCEI